MELIERSVFLASLNQYFEKAATQEGHCMLISGEAGIGKTSLVRVFCQEQKQKAKIYQGACDALFTPRPLAPFYDIMWQVNSRLWTDEKNTEDRSKLFAGFFRELSLKNEKCIIVFEDIHWADEATLDFIKFFARRISQLHCLFILTYRDDEIHGNHPLKSVLGHLPADTTTRVQLTPLSRDIVEKMAKERGYNPKDVYDISGGNPFYVNEILSSYSTGVPDNIKDSVLSVYDRQEKKTKDVWELLSVIPDKFEIKYLEKFEPQFASSLEQCMAAKIIYQRDGLISFKHELYRRTIESSLSPLKRVSLNKKILDLLKVSFEKNNEIERIVHHAKNANEYSTVVQYAPLAANQAASVGAHIEASKLFLTAIEYYQDSDPEKLIQLYESYAYECYLTNQIKEAIIYAGKALTLWKQKNNLEKVGNCLRFLSRLWWFEGNVKNAEYYGEEAIKILEGEPSTKVKAMAFSNMSQLKMQAGRSKESLSWGERSIAMARELDDAEILCHALNNVGTVYMRVKSTYQKGKRLLLQSLEIALQNSFMEHVARAYTNLVVNSIAIRDYALANSSFTPGISYSEERNLDSWTNYMLSWKARMEMETGNWKEAYGIASGLLEKDIQPPLVKTWSAAVIARIKIRRGDTDTISYLEEVKSLLSDSKEIQAIIPVIIAFLEYEWITGKRHLEDDILQNAISMIDHSDPFFDNGEFYFWLWKSRKQDMPHNSSFDYYDLSNPDKARNATELWEKTGCPYEQALALYETGEAGKRKSISLIYDLGAKAVYEKMKREMRTSGIKNIPSGIRKSTQLNPALLTNRELQVLHLLNGGMQNKEIADKLFISSKTVDHHISSILSKLEVKSRVKAVREALKMGIIK